MPQVLRHRWIMMQYQLQFLSQYRYPVHGPWCLRAENVPDNQPKSAGHQSERVYRDNEPCAGWY